MLTRIRLENFKCFDKLSLPLAPLTLLTGFNAAGKSTTLQSLLLLAQSLRSGTRVPELSLIGPLTRLGTPGEVLNEHAQTNELALGMETDDAKVTWLLRADNRTDGISLRISHITTETEHGVNRQEVQNELVLLLPSENISQKARQLVNTLGEIIFLSAVRIGTADVFPAPDEPAPIHADVGFHGEFAPWWFDKYIDEEIVPARCHPDDSALTLRRQYNAWANELFPGAQGNTQRIAKTNLMRLELRISDTDDWRRPSNIGYGLTYAFPVLVAGLLAKPGQVLIIDSPEAHLHPLGQSRIGRFLAQMAATGVQIILETHSDHVLNGIRLAVRDSLIKPDQVMIHFFNRASEIQSVDFPRVVSPAIDTQGNLSEWPDGFFDQSDKDLARLAGWE